MDNYDIYKIYPRCYDLFDLSEFEDFIEDYKFSHVYILNIIIGYFLID